MVAWAAISHTSVISGAGLAGLLDQVWSFCEQRAAVQEAKILSCSKSSNCGVVNVLDRVGFTDF